MPFRNIIVYFCEYFVKKTLKNKRKLMEERRERIITTVIWLFAGLCGLLFILIGLGLVFQILMG
jgi:hypothetical protein